MTFPEWWDWELELTPHVEKRMEDRSFSEVDLRLAADFNGSSQSLSVPSKASLSIPTTGNLTWEAWIRPAVIEFPNASGGYVDWMGKCAEYSPSCEWEAAHRQL